MKVSCAIPSFGRRSLGEGVPGTLIRQLAELKYRDSAGAAPDAPDAAVRIFDSVGAGSRNAH